MRKLGLIRALAGAIASAPAPSYDPTQVWEYYWAFDDVKAGWNTELGGDGTTTMFIDSPQLSVAEGGTYPGLESGTITGHANNPPSGWAVNDTQDALVLVGTGGEIPLKPSRWYGSSDTDLNPGTGNFLWGFHLRYYNGPSGDDTVKGSGATLPSSKLENSGGIRLKTGDNFNTASDGSGTDSGDTAFYLSPAPSNGDNIFIAYMRDVPNQDYYYWYGVVEPGATRANLQRLKAIADNGVYLKTSTGVRNDATTPRLVRFNEGAGVAGILFQKTIADFATADDMVGDHFEYLVSLL